MSVIVVGHHILADLGHHLRKVGLVGRVYVISDANCFPLFGPSLMTALAKEGYQAASRVVPPGDATKSLEWASSLYDWLAEQRAERGDTIVALGGGMVGDLAGFVAATYLRGLPLVQVPTTLVAQVDSSIGGKVGVNHPKAKNLIGAFYQPRLIFIDTALLSTLPQRELASGWAEVVKYAMIMDAPLLDTLEEQVESLKRLDGDITSQVIQRCVAYKVAVVDEDEREQGRRIILNYGHTIGHALEAATDYQRLLHGEAVAIGMVGAAAISHQLGMLDSRIAERQRRMLERYGLPTSCIGVDPDRVLSAMALDKKSRARSVRWVLLRGVGQVEVVHPVPEEVVRRTLDEILLGVNN